MLETLWEKARQGEYVYAVEVAGRIAQSAYYKKEESERALEAVRLIVEYFDRAYSIDKKRTCDAMEHVPLNGIANGTEYAGRVRHIHTTCLKQLTGEVLKNAPGALASIVADSVAATAQLFISIRKIFPGWRP
jgi:hypothetical protein